LVDLDDGEPAGTERARQRGGVGAGELDPDPTQLAVALQPVGELLIAGRSGRNARVPRSLPCPSSAAAWWLSVCASTPPVTRGRSVVIMMKPSSQV
jgi:hypothetical protein